MTRGEIERFEEGLETFEEHGVGILRELFGIWYYGYLVVGGLSIVEVALRISTESSITGFEAGYSMLVLITVAGASIVSSAVILGLVLNVVDRLRGGSA